MSNGPINFGGVGDIDMYPDETDALMRQVCDAGALFGQTKSAATAAIEQGEQEANTGYDTLSVNFRASYGAGEVQLKQLSENVQPLMEHMGSSGAKIVQEYIKHADEDAARMRSLE